MPADAILQANATATAYATSPSNATVPAYATLPANATVNDSYQYSSDFFPLTFSILPLAFQTLL